MSLRLSGSQRETMMPRIPHLKAIQVFEAVARTGNITAAADALAVTQSAISYHIQILETDLGVKLFSRGSRGVQLTTLGQQLLPYVREGLQSIERGLQTVTTHEGSQIVRVAVLPMFASRWLAPRLSKFWDLYPKTELSFIHDNASYTTTDNPAEIADIAIQWGFGDWDNVESQLLLKAPLIAACSPELLKRSPVKSIADLAHHALLHVDNHDMWRQWLVAAGGDESLSDRGLMMSDRHFQLSATMNGVGVSLFIRSFIEEELRSGVLVAPIEQAFTTRYAYYLTKPSRHKHGPAAKRFYDWLSLQAG